MLTVRLSRGGRKNDPVYTIVVTDSRKSRDGGFLEKLGQYNPKDATALKNVKVDRLKILMSKGATISDTVRTLLKNQKIALN
ncbi:MAG: 30S ribosomal protein S16 [Bacteriovorax sp.]|jgi:small subunit ribosomal protein S16|nr:30S ribosomal protein S16 [Bacteriovorax sp.]